LHPSMPRLRRSRIIRDNGIS